ncbi:putative MULE transposase domain-containing protein [Colletotrichum sublineola]|uniref:Putative MULE transposase domain-containing protein n=1 Tax=Colletotrichum sublineola TaxID=1173701 RepID=A0A066X819_COLSU|nr:putative MULE transposase domain-containing protein [Colletotrichum sublineola]
MPLFQVVSSTAVHTTFNAFFCFVSNEDEDTFKWALLQIKSLLQKEKTPLPAVIITDFDKALKNAANSVLPDTAQQLCVWHILKNAVLRIKKKWDGLLQGEPDAADDGDNDEGTCWDHKG